MFFASVFVSHVVHDSGRRSVALFAASHERYRTQRTVMPCIRRQFVRERALLLLKSVFAKVVHTLYALAHNVIICWRIATPTARIIGSGFADGWEGSASRSKQQQHEQQQTNWTARTQNISFGAVSLAAVSFRMSVSIPETWPSVLLRIDGRSVEWMMMLMAIV